MEKNREIKNKIITLSGEPVSGKGTAVKNIVHELIKSNCYKKENIHVISTGELFRNHFNLITGLIQEPSKLNDLAKSDDIKNLFKDSKYRSAFIDALVQIRSAKPDSFHFTIQDVNDLPEFEKIRKVIDNSIDGDIQRIANEINKEYRPDEIWIIDSRLAFANVDESFDIRLVTSDKKVAGQRLLNATDRGAEDSGYSSLEQAIEEIQARKEGEVKRYKEEYGIDLEDESNFDVIIDTSYATPTEIAQTILQCFNSKVNEEKFAKRWTSPKALIPLQDVTATAENCCDGRSFNELSEIIKADGYIPSKPIETIRVDGILYIKDGHHRNFAAANAGKTLVPYYVVATDDEKLPDFPNETARGRAEAAEIEYLYNHEEVFRKTAPSFTYESIYPGIYDKTHKKNHEDHEDIEI